MEMGLIWGNEGQAGSDWFPDLWVNSAIFSEISQTLIIGLGESHECRSGHRVSDADFS